MSDISALATLLRQYGDKILGGNHQLTVTALLLQRLNGAFCMAVEHDAHSSFQVVHTTNAKLHDLHFLHDFVQKVEALVISHGSTTLRGTVDISKFRNLRQLELRRIPIHMVSGLNLIQPRLQCVTASRSLGRPCDLLGGGEGEPLPPASWPELRRLCLPHNTLSALDHSLRLATTLREVDLSHNQLYDVVGLEVLPGLVVLDLSYNRLVGVPALHRLACKTLHALSIAHNQLESLAGVENLSSLRTLNAGWNCLLEASTLTPLSRLSALRHLWLEGNPLSRHEHHRERAARRLHPCTSSATQFMLNGTALSEQERRWVGAACLSLPTSLILTGSDTRQQQASKEIRRGGVRVREAVIADLEEPPEPSLNNSASLAPNCGSLVENCDSEHLETKRQIECLREKLGDSWLGAVPDVLGIPDNATHVGTGSYQRHEAQAWLESQQCPSPVVQVHVAQSPAHQIKHITSERRSSLSTSDEPPSLLSTSPDTDDYNEQPLQQPPLLSLSADESTIECRGNLALGDEEDEEGSDPPILVQRELVTARGDVIIKDFFIIIGPSMMVEREASGSSRVCARWPVDALQSCERTAPGRLTLIFDTVRRDKQLRDYIMEPDDAQNVSRTLSARLEARTLRDMNQVEFHCMRCSTYFSAEITGGMGCGGKRCPSCGSGVIVQEDVDTEIVVEVISTPQLTHSNSQTSIGVTTSTSNAQHAANTHHFFPSKKSSAASLDQSMCGSGLGLAGKSRNGEGGDSDIEVLSNPSQSSIEVLPPADETHSREQSVAPSAEVMPTTQPPAQSKTSMGLTESSSSGSMTDSVCTAYENATSATISGTVPSSVSAMPGSYFNRPIYPIKDRPKIPQPVIYTYSDFSRVDHRLKLYICMHQFKIDNEILTALLRCWVLTAANPDKTPCNGLFVLSSHAIYLLRITGPEGDNPENWLVNEGSWSLNQVVSVLPTAWEFGFKVVVATINGDKQCFHLLLGDTRHASDFFTSICSLMPHMCAVGYPDCQKSIQPRPPLPTVESFAATHFSLASDFLLTGKRGCDISYGPLPVIVSNQYLMLGALGMQWIVDDTKAPCIPHRESITSVMGVEVSSNPPWMLRIHFMEEMKEYGNGEFLNYEDDWILWFVTQKSCHEVVEALRIPWERYFEVPLDVKVYPVLLNIRGCT